MSLKVQSNYSSLQKKQLSKQLFPFLIMNTASSIVFNYISIFVNLYIWQYNRSIQDLCWYNIVLFLSWGLSFICGSMILTKHSIRLIMRISAFSGGASFITLSLLHLHNHFLWIAVIGLLTGMYSGFYYSAQNVSISLLGKGKDFSSFFSIINILAQIIAILNPILFAVIIKLFGFISSFVLMGIFIFAMLLASFQLPNITLSTDAEAQNGFLKSMSWKRVFFTNDLKWMSLNLFLGGVFLQFQGIFALIFTFSVTQDKILIALLNTGYTLSCFIVFFLYRRLVISDSTWVFIGITLTCLGFFLALFQASFILILSNFLTTVGLFLFNTVWSAQQFLSFSKLKPSQQMRIYAWRENLLCTARILVLAFVFPIHNFQGVFFTLIIAFAIISSLIVPVINKKSILEELPI